MMGASIWKTVVLASMVKVSSAALAADWASRSIYQVMTDRFALINGSSTSPCDVNKYCGGTWEAVINNLDYIQGMGFTAIQISPVDKNIPQDTPYGESYHGYWPMDKYSVNTNFGTPQDLKNLADALHNRGMYLMVDVVINDMAFEIPGTLTANATVDYTQFNPFNDQKYFHPFCTITNWDNETNYQDCWFETEYVVLPDLYTESPDVVSLFSTWISGLVANYSIDGLRIDAAKHVNEGFLPGFVQASGVFTLGEVDSAGPADVCKYSNSTGLENYAVYYPLIQAFTAGDMVDLSKAIAAVNNSCKDFTQLATFAEDHDYPRFASYTPDMALAMNALTFTILADGIPRVYYGQEQHFNGNSTPNNREPLWTSNYDTTAPLYNLTAKLNTLRNHAINVDSRYTGNHTTQLYLDNSTMVTTKGPQGVNIVTAFSNQGSKGGSYNLTVPNAFAPGTQVMDVVNCTTITADAGGNITIPMGAGIPHVYFPTFNLNGSGLCGTTNTTGTTNNAANNTSSSPSKSSTTAKKSEGGLVQFHVPTFALCIVIAFGFWLI